MPETDAPPRGDGDRVSGDSRLNLQMEIDATTFM
jgi:hypothetical protein